MQRMWITKNIYLVEKKCWVKKMIIQRKNFVKEMDEKNPREKSWSKILSLKKSQSTVDQNLDTFLIINPMIFLKMLRFLSDSLNIEN